MRLIRRGHTWVVNVYDCSRVIEPLHPDKALIRQHVIIAPDEATACHKFLGSPGAGELHKPGIVYTIDRPEYVI